MQIKKIFSDDIFIYMLDEKNNEINLTDTRKVNQYERDNKIELKDILIDYFNLIDNKVSSVLQEINSMAIEYNIDHYMFGVHGDNGLCIIDYNIKNRLSTIDCKVRIFYKKNQELKLMILFEKGTNGLNPGFNYYLNFDNINFQIIKPQIENYMKANNDKERELKIIDYFTNSIKANINYYYNN